MARRTPSQCQAGKWQGRAERVLAGLLAAQSAIRLKAHWILPMTWETASRTFWSKEGVQTRSALHGGAGSGSIAECRP